MRSLVTDGDLRLSAWQRVREFAVPPAMIETATARRAVGDWAGACAAARVDAELDLRIVARRHGRELAARLRDDLRQLVPDLLRWHFPRVLPDGLLRPALTVPLARYGPADLVVRTAPAWVDAGQRISLSLWERSRSPDAWPSRRFRLDLHRHLWDARQVDDLGIRAGVAGWPGIAGDPVLSLPDDCAVHRWPAEAALVREADGRPDLPVIARVSARLRIAVDPGGAATTVRVAGRAGPAWPLLPDVATWVSPDLELLRAGLIDAGRLHPLVAAVLAPGHRPRRAVPAGAAHRVHCRGAEHRIGLVDGVLTALDHDPVELRREELLVALGGTPLPCLQVIDQVHRDPQGLADIQARLDHGDAAGALATVECLLGPGATLRSGALRDALNTAAERRVVYGLYRAGLISRAPFRQPPRPDRRPVR